jgi:glycosyltransferase involved in cell wall biosynthesis
LAAPLYGIIEDIDTTVRKLLWICPTWTPYNDFFFRNIERALDGCFEVVYLDREANFHPWTIRNMGDYNKNFHRANTLSIGALSLKALLMRPCAVVIAGWNYPSVLALAMCCKFLGIHYAIWTDTPSIRPRRRWFGAGRKFILGSLLAGATRVWGTGEVAMQRLQLLGADANRLRNMPYFIDLDLFLRSPSKSVGGISNRRFVKIVSLGRLNNEQKGFDKAIDAMAILRSSTRHLFIYDIYGDGPDRAKLEAQILTLGLNDCVQIHNWLNYDETAAILKQTDMFLHPSSFDPFAVSVLEAMAAGAIVVGSEQAMSVATRIVHNVNGYILASTAPSSIAEMLGRAMNEKERWQEMSEAARLTAEDWPVTRGLDIVDEFLRTAGAIPEATRAEKS